MMLFTKIFHGDADARFFETKFCGDIDGTDDRQPVSENENGFKIILRRFINDHSFYPLIFLYLFLVLRTFQAAYAAYALLYHKTQIRQTEKSS